MDGSTSISFRRTLDETVAVQQIAWWRPASRFVVVQYAKNGHLEAYGKRLDLDKRAFLDGFDDHALNAKLNMLIPEIMQAVSERRNNVRTEKQDAAPSRGFSA